MKESIDEGVDVTMNQGVVVGIDGSAQAMNAARWAADHAVATGSDLRIVTVAHTLTGPVEVASRVRAGHHHRHDDYLKEARTEVGQAHPELSVSTVLRHGDTLRELIQESGRAGAVVIGSRGSGGFSGLLLGSTSLRLTARAHAPVIVVPHSSPRRSGIVVGDDGSDQAIAARTFAFWQARCRRQSLHVVRVIAGAYWYGPEGPYGEWLRAAIRRGEDSLAAELDPWRQDHPEVPVRTSVLWGHPADVLRSQAQDSALLVIGTRGHGWATSLLLGSISHNVLHHAPCPVAVLGPPEV